MSQPKADRLTSQDLTSQDLISQDLASAWWITLLRGMPRMNQFRGEIMRIIIQRVNHASVTVDDTVCGAVERGLMLLVGFGSGDTDQALRPMAEKVLHMRIFPNEEGRFHFSVKDIAGGILAIPQFTLYADTSKGRRPDFFGALQPQQASPLFDSFCALLAESVPVERGVFGAHMKVLFENDGPVTISLDSEES